MKHNLTTPRYIIAIYFNTELSMFGLAPSPMEEGAKGPQNNLRGYGGPRAPQQDLQELEGGVQSVPNL